VPGDGSVVVFGVDVAGILVNKGEFSLEGCWLIWRSFILRHGLLV